MLRMQSQVANRFSGRSSEMMVQLQDGGWTGY